MNLQTQVLSVLDETLSLRGKTSTFSASTPLLGEIPEIDSMAVVNILTALEDRFDIIVEDDEIDGAVFETVESLVRFVEQKV